MLISLIFWITKSDCNLSGDRYKNLYLPNFKLSNKETISSVVALLLIVRALIPLFLNCSVWSFIKEINGDITKHTPSRINPGT